jgi:sec-independent protein translocase protein TatC
MTDPTFPRTEGSFDPVESFQMPLMEHLRELRVRIIKATLAATAGVLVCLAFVTDIWDFLVAPMNAALAARNAQLVEQVPGAPVMGDTLAVHGLLEAFMTQLKVAGVAGVLLASPALSYQLWQFVAPALYPNEKRMVMPLVASSTSLFLLGAAFCYAVIFQFAFPFFLEITPENVQAVVSIENYLGLATRLLLAFGVCFQLPVIAYFLARVGLIDHIDMWNFIRYAIVAIFTISAILTPPDVFSQVLMAIPMTILYFIGMGVAWAFTTKVREPAPAA